jgi:DNA repair protein RAD5
MTHASVLAMLLQMRQACDHPFLVLSRADCSKDLNAIGDVLLKRWQQRTAEQQQQQQQQQAGSGSGASGPVHSGPAFIHNALRELSRSSSLGVGAGAGAAGAGAPLPLPPSETAAPDSNLAAPDSNLAAPDSNLGASDHEVVQSCCVICLDAPEDAVITNCAHVFCRECISGCLANAMGAAPCPVCRETVHRADLLTLPRKSRFAVDLDKAWRPSTKLTALMADLTETLSTALGPPVVVVPSTSVVPSVRKAVIISQWTAMLDLVQRPLEHEGIEYAQQR